MRNWLRSEIAAIDELSHEAVPARHSNRMKSYRNLIPNPWDDKNISAWREYHNKHHDFSANDQHWVKPQLAGLVY
jgi:hypothetical protein